MLAGYAVLDGWDIGAGLLHFVVARTPADRRLVVSALGPLWSWHEVWLVAAGGVLFVAFPSVLATALAGFYLAVFALLWALLLRGLALEFGGHLEDRMWRAFWDQVFAWSNLLLAVLLGAALGNLLRGLPIDASGRFTLSFFTDFGVRGLVGILDWYTLSVAGFTVVCLAAHGASYLALRTEGPVHDRSVAVARGLWPAVFILLIGVSLETAYVRPQLFAEMVRRPLAWLSVGVVLAGMGAIESGQRRGRERRAFLGGAAFIAGLLGAGAASVFPVLLYSTLDARYSITAQAGAAGGPALRLAILWWPVAIVLSVACATLVGRRFSGRVRPAPSS